MAGDIDWTWIWAVGLIVFAVGIGCGIGIAYLMPGNRRRAQALQEKLSRLQQEFDSYHEQVSQHFLKTSELVQKMTDSYRDVYEHLASGSQALCQTPVSTPQLDIPEHPTLEEGIRARAKDEKTVTEPSPVDRGEAEEPDSDAFLGDAPRVPTLDAENEQRRAGKPTGQSAAPGG
jgi:uncharacterized membrane-anchored protein YhcB (DUF1043 family)